MRQYLSLLSDVRQGHPKHPTRAESGQTKNPTVGLSNVHFGHWLDSGFPLLTTRKINWSGLVGELRAFLEGFTNERNFADLGCNFWKPWARKSGDLGPIYGAQWKAHGQLKHVLHSLRYSPYDRRMVVSAWRPDEHHKMVLPPCHVMWNVSVYNDRVSLFWAQRSADFPIGVPYNIGSYALLTHLLAEWGGFGVGNLSAVFCDAHVYRNQLEGVEEQLSRTPGELPQVRVWFNDPDNFWSWDCDLIGYEPQPHINFGEVEV